MSALEGDEVKAPLRPQHLAPALAAGVPIALAVLVRSEQSLWGVVLASGAFLLVWLAAIDLESRLVPNRIVLPATAVVLVIAIGLDPVDGGTHTLAAVLAALALAVPVLLRPGGLGMGDAKLAALLGALLGGSVVVALLIAFTLVALVGVGRLATRGRVALKDQLPLVPFLAAGAIATLLLG